MINDHAVDILIITETWLTSKDKAWIEMTNLHKNDLQLHTSSRQQGKGSGIALICKTHYSVKCISKGFASSFEYATWMITAKKCQLTITGIYHPPYSMKNRITNETFMDEFTKFTMNLLSMHSNNVIPGDFNLHISNDNDAEAVIFTDTCEAFGLYQYVMFPTHKSGNILNLVLTEVGSEVNVLRSQRGPFISDHAAVLTQLNIKRPSPERQTCFIRKVRDITPEQWVDAFQDSGLSLSDDLDEMVTGLDTALNTG